MPKHERKTANTKGVLSKNSTGYKTDGKSVNGHKRNAKIHSRIYLYTSVCCEYTNWVKAIPLVDQKSGTIVDAILFRIICEYGTPKAIICDEGPAFTSDLMKMYFHAMNTKPYYISPMNHGSNRAERYIRTLNDILCRNLTGIGDKWPLFVLPSC